VWTVLRVLDVGADIIVVEIKWEADGAVTLRRFFVDSELRLVETDR